MRILECSRQAMMVTGWGVGSRGGKEWPGYGQSRREGGLGEKTGSSEASREQRTFQNFPSIAFYWSKQFNLHWSLTKGQDSVTGFCLWVRPLQDSGGPRETELRMCRRAGWLFISRPLWKAPSILGDDLPPLTEPPKGSLLVDPRSNQVDPKIKNHSPWEVYKAEIKTTKPPPPL